MFIGTFSDTTILALAKKFAGSGSGGGTSWHFETVTVLPDPSTADSSALYLLLIDETSTTNKYEEYIVTNGAWESLGFLNIDLSDYATVEQLNDITAIVSLSSLGLENYTGTTLSFISAIKASTMAVGSMAIGGVSLSDLPGNLSNCEILVARMDAYVTNLSISSNNAAPYQWFYNHWSGGESSDNKWRSPMDDVYTKDEVDTFISDLELDVADLQEDTEDIQGSLFEWEALTQAEYDALTSKESKLYVIVEAVE